MGDDSGDDDAPTSCAPTQLGDAIDETDAHTAWSLDDGEEWPPPRRLTPARITALAVVAAVGAVAAAGAAYYVTVVSQPQLGSVAMVTPRVELDAVRLPPVGPSGFEIPPPPPPTTVTQIVAAPVEEARSADNPDFTVSQMARFDQQFLSALQANYWRIDDPSLIILRAHQVCIEYGTGSTPAMVYQKLRGLGMNDNEASSFMVATRQSYPDCP